MKAVVLLSDTNSREVTTPQGWVLCNPIHVFPATLTFTTLKPWTVLEWFPNVMSE